jgi:ElaB/YqjD/DUF883 family membrane-anchored ribosome-binding protein
VADTDYGNLSESRITRGQRETGEAVRSIANKAAGKVKDTAAYFRNRDVNAIVEDARKYVVANPGPALVGALVVGFFAGRLLRRG